MRVVLVYKTFSGDKEEVMMYREEIQSLSMTYFSQQQNNGKGLDSFN